jgi:hypothetical protein
LAGIEINPFAQELASVVIWIGYSAMDAFNGFNPPNNPVLEPIKSIRLMDAILDLSDPENPKEPEWPEAEFIVGNPPFLGLGPLRGSSYSQPTTTSSSVSCNPALCFETFPFPEPTDAQRDAISEAAKELDRLRSNWLNPPEWTRTEVLEFPGSVDGPWKRYVDPATVDERGIGTVRYPRLVPKDAETAKELKKRTLTNLYNQRPTWLDLAHRRLDEAVFEAYGWPADLSDDDLARAAAKPPGCWPELNPSKHWRHRAVVRILFLNAQQQPLCGSL